jgi:serine/threonine-protein kinase
VILTVSAGPQLAKVPALVGFQRAVAVQQIRAAGFVPDVAEEEDPVAKGQVIRQDPSAGSRIERGATVTIVVSEGEEKPTVPNVIGDLRRQAVEEVRAAGLEPSVSEQETDVPSKVGRATDQFPPPGAEVEPGSTVTIVVGKAPPVEPEVEE